ncbi:MAG: SDR family NAD(P)-dependent oxidoreductase [Myxococcota bacterium]|nr:SDR family NAD(P)-dependent oxidoreductase [Myxococcota bacterium]
MSELRGRVAAVTGAGSGIGRALAVELARSHCDVALSDVDEASLEETRKLVLATGRRAFARVVDVRDAEAVDAWARDVVAEFGGVQLIFNNAGVALAARLTRVTLDEFRWLMDVDFWGVVHGTKSFLPHFQAAGEGHVVNVSSVFGLIAFPGNGTYNAAKFAVRGFTEALAIELEMEGSPVQVSCVHPGGIKTNIARLARVGTDEEQPDRAEMSDAFDRAARTTPERAAQVILDGVRRNRRRILIGPDARVISGVQRLLPVGYQRLLARFIPFEPGQV